MRWIHHHENATMSVPADHAFGSFFSNCDSTSFASKISDGA
jgi:hypothetical protein